MITSSNFTGNNVNNICLLCLKNKVCKYKDKVEKINNELQLKLEDILKNQVKIPKNDADFPEFSIATRCKYSDYSTGYAIRGCTTEKITGFGNDSGSYINLPYSSISTTVTNANTSKASTSGFIHVQAGSKDDVVDNNGNTAIINNTKNIWP